MGKMYLKLYKRRNKSIVGNLSKRPRKRGKAIKVIRVEV